MGLRLVHIIPATRGEDDVKRPLFDIITTAHTGPDNAGAFDVRIIGRYDALDGLEIGHTENVTVTEAMEYATATLDAFMSEVMPTN